jgi:hypothetical protein
MIRAPLEASITKRFLFIYFASSGHEPAGRGRGRGDWGKSVDRVSATAAADDTSRAYRSSRRVLRLQCTVVIPCRQAHRPGGQLLQPLHCIALGYVEATLGCASCMWHVVLAWYDRQQTNGTQRTRYALAQDEYRHREQATSHQGTSLASHAHLALGWMDPPRISPHLIPYSAALPYIHAFSMRLVHLDSTRHHRPSINQFDGN